MPSVRARISSSVAIHVKPLFATSGTIASDTDPSDGQRPVGRRPNRRSWYAAARARRSAAEREQLGVPWVHLNHALVLRVEEILEDEIDIAVGEVGGRPEAQLEVPVARAIGRERLELDEHRGYQVEGHLHLRELAHQRGHAVVILQRVEPHPRKDVLPRDEVFVERLMHVPQDGYASHNRLTA